MNKLLKNKEKLKQFREFKKDWNGCGSNPFKPRYLDYIEDILNCIDEELQPKIFPIQGDFPLVQFEWENSSRDFYLEMVVDLFDVYKIFYTLNGKDCIDEDGFTITIKKENINSILKLILYSDEWRK